MPLNGGSWGHATGPQPVFLIFGKPGNWQLQFSCDQLRSSPVASLCTSCQLDFETLVFIIQSCRIERQGGFLQILLGFLNDKGKVFLGQVLDWFEVLPC